MVAFATAHLFLSSPALGQTRNEWRAIENRTGVTRKNACLLLALDLTPCDDEPSKPLPKSERGWGKGHPKTYDVSR